MAHEDPALVGARRRAKELREFYSHLVTYVLVCTLLVVIDLANNSASGTEFLGLSWAYWPIFGWGIAVAIHAFKTFVGVDGWEERKAEQLYEKEKERDLLDH
ncbi:MAG: 2TM domain-containing protein [Acidimicrobiia bacterium]|nr:2TM domain-containing protein [Acidimicrobiia bacterium]MBT8193135.1 2TM domain-containing protein [Acidimicrobiia bacterium]NNF88226.1 2TM domain-containing protein [Acidimicrobiia bacterium]NNJ46900.1 2TM domain-containing protein [Acidimicrobiia bacterium]NNL13810.1 2TM domain-containing protein [Acidimicrobiia bacterium]